MKQNKVSYLSQDKPTSQGGEMRRGPVTKEFLNRHRHITAGGCWEWTRAKDGHGYGHVTVIYKKTLVHRMAFELWNGPIPDGLFVLHRCDNPPCFNPDHLFTGTVSDNTKDSIAKGRFKPPGGAFGEEHPRSILTESQVADIIELRLKGVQRKPLALVFGVSVHTIAAISNGRLWSHIPRGKERFAQWREKHEDMNKKDWK